MSKHLASYPGVLGGGQNARYWIEDMPWGKVTFNAHLQRLAHVGSWGTQVLQAVSDLLFAHARIFPDFCPSPSPSPKVYTSHTRT